MHRSTWKRGESKVARFFGTERTPLSGGNSKITRSDILHEKLFVEVKHLSKMAVWKLFEGVKEKAIKERKKPVLALKQKGKAGFIICIHSKDFNQILKRLGYSHVAMKDIIKNIDNE